MKQGKFGAIPPGWVGGFAQSNKAFAYPNPDLSSLKLLGNLDNINLLQRQQVVWWPEFSWQSVPGLEASRCFQMFAPDISRLGYTDEGRVYSIICPQQGTCSKLFGCLNVEVTVTGQRGWVDETAKLCAADMTVEGKIWFTPSTLANPLVKALWKLFVKYGQPFPDEKANAIIVTLFNSEDPTNTVLPVRIGETTRFKSPDFARHWADYAWEVANVEVQIGPIKQIGIPVVDDFNALVMTAFNIASGNLLTPGNILTWNVWFEEPSLVNQQEWADHAAKWRDSIDADHGSPCGDGTPPRYFNGNPFYASEAAFVQVVIAIYEYIEKHLANEDLVTQKIAPYLENHVKRQGLVSDKIKPYLEKYRAKAY